MPGTTKKDKVVNPKSLIGPNSKYVKLISCDGVEFVVPRKSAYISRTIKSMFVAPGATKPGQPSSLVLKNITSDVLEVVVRFFEFHKKYNFSAVPPPDFPIDRRISDQVYEAALYLAL